MRKTASNLRNFLSKSTTNLAISEENNPAEGKAKDQASEDKVKETAEATSLKSVKSARIKDVQEGHADIARDLRRGSHDSSADSIDDKLPVINIDEAINKAGLGLGTLLYVAGPYFITAFQGAEMAVISIVVFMVLCTWDLNDSYTFEIQFCTILGTFVGSAVCSSLSDRFGRRKILIIASGGILLLGLLTSMAPDENLYLTYQFLIGFTLGGAMGPAAALLVEVVPSRWRIAALTIKSMTKATGTIMTIIIIWLLDDTGGWRAVIIIIHLAIAPAIVFFCISHDSPRYSIVKDEEENAKLALTQLQSLNKKNICKRIYYEGSPVDDDDEVDVTPPSLSPELLYKDRPITPVSLSLLECQSLSGLYNYKFVKTKAKATTPLSGSNGDTYNTLETGELTTENGFLARLRSIGNSFSNTESGASVADVILMVAYGFVVQAIYYGYNFYLPILMKKPDTSNASNDENGCTMVQDNQLLELAVTNMVGPLGSILAAVCAIWLGRKRTGYVTAILMIITNCYFYTKPSESSSFEMILILTSVLKCSADLLGLVVATEYFPTSSRGQGLSLFFSGGKFGAALSVVVCVFGYDKNPIAVPAYLTALSLAWLLIVLLTKETKGRHLLDI